MKICCLPLSFWWSSEQKKNKNIILLKVTASVKSKDNRITEVTGYHERRHSLYSLITYIGIYSEKGWIVCIYITELLCCTPENSTTFSSTIL